MSVISNNVLAGAAGQSTGGAAAGYTIERSLRFNGDDSAFLTKTYASAGSRTTWTWSGWAKIDSSDRKVLFSAADGAGNFFLIDFYQEQLWIYNYTSGSYDTRLSTNQVFRDSSAWFHLVFVFDTTNATADDRHRLYINGEQVTSFSARTNPTQNYQGYVNSTGAHYISGYTSTGTLPWNGYIADVHFIDGQALAATDFGEYDDNNVWQPKAYSGTYGTNGYHLDFSSNSSASALGTDSSGNSNTWTVNNLSVASGAGNDSLIDTPTNYTASSGNNGGNYCTWSSLDKDADVTLANGNLDMSQTNAGACRGTIGVTSGKWYWEITKGSTANQVMGVATSDGLPSTYLGGWAGSAGWATNNGILYANASSIFTSANSNNMGVLSAGTVIGLALDLDSTQRTLKFYTNGTLVTTNHLNIADSNLPVHPAIGTNVVDSGTNVANFGQRPFEYTPPTGHLPLCTANLPDPAIEDSSTAMDVSLWTGNGTSQTIKRTDGTSLGFSPDFVWIKRRNGGNGSRLFDTVRGATKYLESYDTTIETTDVQTLTAFNSDGFSLGSSGHVNGSFTPAGTYVGWSWDAGADSSKTYTVKVVSDSGNKFRFDDFGTSAVTLDLEEGSTYVFDQSDSSNATHPLRFSTTSDGTHGSGTEYTTGVTTTGTPGSAGAKTTITVASGAPTLYYYCSSHSGMGGQANTNSTAGASNFDGSTQSVVRANPSAGFSIVSYTGSGSNATIGHGLGATPDSIIIKSRSSSVSWVVNHKDLSSRTDHYLLLDTTNAEGNVTSFFNTGFDSTTFGVGNGYGGVNYLGDDYIAYCFAPVEGYSSFGSYTGDGLDPGPFVYTGFQPRWLMIKATTGSTTSDWWFIWDTEREAYNQQAYVLYANDAIVEQTSVYVELDILSNGFKLRNNYEGLNEDGTKYIYMAFAEHPFKTARAR